MIKKIALAVMLMAVMPATAQNSRYTIIENDPDKARTTTLDLKIFDLGWYQGMGMRLGGRVHTMLTEKMEPFLELKKAFVNDPAISDGSLPESVICRGGIKGAVFAEAGCNYYFFSRKVKAKTRMNLNAIEQGKTIVQYYSKVPTVVKHLLGARGGITYTRKGVDFYDPSHPYYNYKSADGMYIVPIDDWDPKVAHYQPAGFAADPYSNFRTFAVFAGISYKKIKHTVIDVEEHGHRQRASNLDVYADVIVAPYMSISNVLDTNKREWIIAPKSGTMQHFGYRVGFCRHSGRTVGCTYTIEAGKKPAPIIGQGFFYAGGFINLSWGICISSAWNLLGHSTTKPVLPADIPDTSSPKI